MTPEKWKQTRQLYEAALKIGLDERPRFLAENCGGDRELLQELGSLLACSDDAGEFLEKPAIGEMAEVILARRSLAGRKIRQYKILELLGAGGMGEVYLAEDTRMKRRIALKILPDTHGDNRSVRRFEQEAYAVSALNHPNILTVHELGEENGVNFIASEFIKGETLRARLNRAGILSLPGALDIALQVAAALRAAHESGIVHRDIKPENVMIRDDGLVKVLDFGLAKLSLEKARNIHNEGDPLFQTTRGMIMGTVAYMSPEQARGRETDARSDIWSLGVVLYEMLTGKPLFKGETSSDTLASILTREPEFSEKELPAPLVDILLKTLQKDREKRYQTVEELFVDLNAVKSGPLAIRASADAGTATPLRSRLSNRYMAAAGALLIALAAVGVIWKIVPAGRNRASPNLLASLRARQLITWDAEAGEVDVGARFSPNGTMIAYTLTKNGISNIWTKQVPDGKPNQVTDGKWNYYNPIWSPDGQRIAFISNRDNQLGIWTMPFSGGELTFIRPAETTGTCLLKWSRNGEKIYLQDDSPEKGLNVWAVDLASKQISPMTNFETASLEQFFNISPDDDRIAYSAGPDGSRHIFVMPVGGGVPRQVTNDNGANDEYPHWLPDGKRMIYSSQRDGIFQTCIVYLDEGRTEQINLGISDTLIGDVAPDGGRILFQQFREESDLWKIGADGKSETQITSDTGLELWPDVSPPDGRNIVFQEMTESKHLLEGTLLVRSLDDARQINIASNGFSPAFSPNGQKVAFLRDDGNRINLWTTDRTGAGERQLTTGGVWFPGFSLTPYNRVQVRDYSWSPDSGSLIYCAEKEGIWNVWLVAADGSAAPRRISDNSDNTIRFQGPFFAPDGKRIAWTSAPKPSPGGKKMTNLYLWNDGSSAIVFSSESDVKLIGWAGNNLLIARPEGASIAKPVNILLTLIYPDHVRDIASIDAVYFNNIRLSNDGRMVAFAAREDSKDNIGVISVPGDKSVKITTNADPTAYISSIAWSPDGKTVYFGKQKQVGTISMIENFK